MTLKGRRSVIGRKPNIEWSDKSWNSTTGCPGPNGVRCKGCWAYMRSLRLAGRFGYPKHNPFQVTRHLDKVDLPRKRKKPTVWFYESMGDWQAPQVKREWRQQDLKTMDECPQHIFVTLTKFYDNLGNVVLDSPEGDIPLNVIVGVSVTNWEQLRGIDKLREVPAFTRLVCFEPLLEDLQEVDLTGIHWVIIGARTRQGRTPEFQPEWEWVFKIMNKAHRLKIPVFLKPNLKYPDTYPIEETPFERIRSALSIEGIPAQKKMEEVV